MTLTFTIANTSDYDAENVYISSSDGLRTEPLGQIDAGDSRVFSRAHDVTAEELESGRITYIFSHDGVAGDPDTVNYTVDCPIERAIARAEVEFTRQFSAAYARPGDVVTITYRVRNTGNVPIDDLRVDDAPGEYAGRADSLEVGATRLFISRVAVEDVTVSAPRLRYSVPAEGGEEREVDAHGGAHPAGRRTAHRHARPRPRNRARGRNGDGHADHHEPWQRQLLRHGRLRRELWRPRGRRSGNGRRHADDDHRARIPRARRRQLSTARARAQLLRGRRRNAHRAGLPARPARRERRGDLRLRRGRLSADRRRRRCARGRLHRQRGRRERPRGRAQRNSTGTQLRAFDFLAGRFTTHRRVYVPVSQTGELAFSLRYTNAAGVERTVESPPVRVEIARGGQRLDRSRKTRPIPASR